MVKKRYILGCYIIGVVLLMSFVSAASSASVAYIYKSKTDTKIINLFSDLKLKVDLIKESTLPQDLSSYKFIFIGDERFSEEIPIDKYPSVIMNHYITGKVGLGNDGISRLVSTMPLQVNFNGDEVAVYSSAKDSRGISIPYYYLDKQNKASSLSQYAGTYTTSSGANFGDVISLGTKGDELVNGNVLQDNLCFFGISKTDYWTDEAETLFKDCIKHVFDYTTIPEPVITCSKDSDCGVNQLIGSPFCSNNNVFKNYITWTCNNPGTEGSYCNNETVGQLVQECQLGCLNGKCKEPAVIVCSNNNDCNDNNSSTEDICNNPGTSNSICIHNIYLNPITCNSNNDCNDNNSTTVDTCINNGTTDSMCIYNIYNTNNITNNITYIKLVTFVAVPSQDSVKLSFSAITDNNILVKGYLLSMDRQKWILVTSPSTSYTFNGLSPSTDYVFYAKAIDSKNISSDEMNITVRTLNVPPVTPPSSGGGGGGGGSITPITGSFSYCTITWECSEWTACKDSKQTRVCSYPADKCKPEQDKPIEAQSCVETPVVISTDNTTGADNNDTGTKSNVITGASIAELLGKNSWIAAVAILVIGGIVYYFARKFTKTA